MLRSIARILPRPRVLPWALFLAPIALLSSCSGERKSAETASNGSGVVELTAEQVASSQLTTVRVEEREAFDTLTLPSTLELDPQRSWSVSPALPGVVTQIAALPPAKVRKGQPLARLQSAALGDAEAAWLEARAVLRTAQAERDRSEGLRKNGVVSESQWLKVDTEYQRASALFDLAERKLGMSGSLARDDVEALTTEGRPLGELVLASPADGTIIESHLRGGQSLAAGEIAFEIADLSRLWVTVHLPVAILSRVAPGAPAKVYVTGGSQRHWAGRLESVGSKVREEDQTVEARVGLINEGGFLRPGMYAKVDLVSVPTRAMMVPSGALFTVGNQAYVFKRTAPTKYLPINVTTRPAVGDWIPLTGAGLVAGDEVVVGGLAELKSHWLYQQ